MSVPIELPKNLQDYSGRLISIPVSEQRSGELLLTLSAELVNDSAPSAANLNKLFKAITDGGMKIDGRPVKSTVLKRADDDKTLIYLDWTTEGNQSSVAPELGIECRAAVSDGLHNSNSHLIYWKDAFWLIHASSPYHFATTECKLVLWRSADAREWTKVRTFNVQDEDIRDPKFSVIYNKLFIYVLKSFVSDSSEPYTTAYTYTEDGEHFIELTDLLDNHGWLFWNPKTRDGETWYVPAYWGGHGNSILLKTSDGERFKAIGYIHQGKKGLVNDRNDETDFDFLADGSMISTQRLEYSEDHNGDIKACTHIAVSEPPYTSWQALGRDYSTRLDGPSLFSYNGRVYATGRRNPYDSTKGPNFIGSVFGRKRTSLYEVTKKGLVWLTDFPSAGDTSYGGCVCKDGYLYASYYSSTLEADWPWYVGMLSPSDIRIVKLSLNKMEALADAQIRSYDEKGLWNMRL
jgi:hypothetical protein